MTSRAGDAPGIDAHEQGPASDSTDPPTPSAQHGQPVAWVQLARVLAIVAVIAIHVASSLVTRPSHVTSFWFGNIVESASRWCVPVFVMVSGYLLLSNPRTADARPFYRRRLARLGLPLVFWTVAYLAFGHVVRGVPRDLEEAARSVASGRPYFHLYFVYLIAGLYVVAPALRIFVASARRSSLMLAVSVAFGLAMVDSILSSIAGIGTPNAITRFAPYVGFFLAGYLLAAVEPSRGREQLAIAVVAGGIIVTAVGTAILVQPGLLGLGRGRYLYEYLSITTVPTSLAVFLLLVWSGPLVDGVTGRRWWRVVPVVSTISFGIYLVHPMVLVGLGWVGITARMTTAPIAVAVTVGLALLISACLVIVGGRIPGVRHVL